VSDSGAAWVIGLVVSLPLLGWFVSRIVVRGGFEGISWLKRRTFAPWQGRYYAYANIHLRAEEHDGSLVFIESDLLKVIEQRESTTVKLFGPAERLVLEESGETALTQAGCERLLLKCPHPEAKKLLLFLQRECFKPHAKRRERAPS
jgi:hypothetical protein